MNISHITTITQIKEFLKASSGFNMKPGTKAEIYAWLQTFLIKIEYGRLKKKGKGQVKEYIAKVTGYSDVQIKRLLKKSRHIFPKLRRGFHTNPL